MASQCTEEQNYIRVCRILDIEGSAILKDILFEEIGGSANLQAILRFSQDKIMALTKAQVLSRVQAEAVYPTNGTYAVNLNKVDIATMCELLKIVATSIPQDFKWDEKPKAHETTKFHNVLRMKFLDDELQKKSKNKLSLFEFSYYWKEVDRILGRLGVDAKLIELYKRESLEHTQYELQRNEIQKINNTEQIMGIQPKSKCGSCCCWCSLLFAIAAGLLAYLIANFTPEPGYGYIDSTKCTTITANWGQHIHCPEGFVVTGSCGAGEDGDCPGGTFLHLKCCPVVKYTDDPKCDRTKQKFKTWYNDLKSCPGTSLLTGGCASGKDADCEGQFNTLYCQNDCRLTVDSNSCTWSGAGWGQYIECKPNQVLKGRCGAGRDADCPLNGRHYWMIIQCCDLLHKDRSTYEKYMLKAKKALDLLDAKSDYL